jgi:hypothetical protein
LKMSLAVQSLSMPAVLSVGNINFWFFVRSLGVRSEEWMTVF